MAGGDDVTLDMDDDGDIKTILTNDGTGVRLSIQGGSNVVEVAHPVKGEVTLPSAVVRAWLIEDGEDGSVYPLPFSSSGSLRVGFDDNQAMMDEDDVVLVASYRGHKYINQSPSSISSTGMHHVSLGLPGPEFWRPYLYSSLQRTPLRPPDSVQKVSKSNAVAIYGGGFCNAGKSSYPFADDSVEEVADLDESDFSSRGQWDVLQLWVVLFVLTAIVTALIVIWLVRSSRRLRRLALGEERPIEPAETTADSGITTASCMFPVDVY